MKILDSYLKADDAYAPNFPHENWYEDERFFLNPFFTNLNSHITVMRNLPPELSGALCSKTSRTSGYLPRVLLKEFLEPILSGGDKGLRDDLVAFINVLNRYGVNGVLQNSRAREFYAKWLADYGDDSIAQVSGSYLIMRYVSQVAMKYIEDQRIGLEPIEQSTRFVLDFSKKVSGKYRYYVPWPDLERLGLLKEYTDVLDELFDTYNALIPKLTVWLAANFKEKPKVIEKKALDTLRGLLPCATVGQVAFRGNGQAFEYLINRTAEHELGELRWISSAVYRELNEEIPSLLLRLKEEKAELYQEYLQQRKKNMKQAMADLCDEKRFRKFRDYLACVSRPDVRLVEFDIGAIDSFLTGMLYPESHSAWVTLRRFIKKLPQVEKIEIIRKYLDGRTERWQKVGRAFENSYVRFDIVMDVGAYRDLHRHRMLTQERQRFSTLHGFNVPEEVKLAGLTDEYIKPLIASDKLYRKLAGLAGDEFAQYVVPMCALMRFYQYENFREMFHEFPLRTGPQGHPSYRSIEQAKFRLLEKRFPDICKFLMVDMKEYAFARRGMDEKIAAKEEKILKNLREKD